MTLCGVYFFPKSPSMGETMLQPEQTLHSWGIGISKSEIDVLQTHLGDKHSIDLFAVDSLPDAEDIKLANPFLIWISTEFSKRLPNMDKKRKELLDAIPKVLLLGDSYTLADFEIACDNGITDILRGDITKERIADITRRALEAQAIHHDVQCMTREIALERELLERKNELLSFLVSFITNTTEILDIEYILQTAFTGLGKLLPVKSMHAALWEHDEHSLNLSLFICAPEKSPNHGLWRSTLLEHAKAMTGKDLSVQECSRLHLADQPKKWENCSPKDDIILNLPIVNGHELIGVLMLTTSMERHLGRDQAVALDSAMRHFALSIKNAQRFRLMQSYADYDALTNVHSRRHFESKFEQEMQRFNRYGQSLSLIMLDIDHFKKINDSRGHHAGDIVLREVASLIAESIRATDYCARYGGEEFAILLPHTSGRNAFTWAERLRNRISNHTFMKEGDPLQLTVSMGLASLTPGTVKKKQALLCEADAALYHAKQSGRNRTYSGNVPLQQDNVMTG